MLTSCGTEQSPPPFAHPPHYQCVPMMFFDHGSADLTENTKKILTMYLEGKVCPVWAHLTPEFTFIVRGFTDKSGSPEANMALSIRRAGAVRDFMVSFGIAATRIEVVGYGDTKPMVLNTVAREPQNRFVTVSLARNGREQHYQ